MQTTTTTRQEETGFLPARRFSAGDLVAVLWEDRWLRARALDDDDPRIFFLPVMREDTGEIFHTLRSFARPLIAVETSA